MTQVDSALSAAQSVLYPKGLDNVVAASRAQHAATVEAAHEARDAYLKKVHCLFARSLIFLLSSQV